MTIKGTYPESKGGNFKIVDTIIRPHPVGIDSAFITAQSKGTEPQCFICKRLVRDGKQDKVLPISEHKADVLLVECKLEIQPMPDELREWLNSIRAEAVKNGYEGFAFKRYEPPKPVRVWKNYKAPPSYNIDKHQGAGCFLEPPNHPRYFVRSIYTRHGNSPPRPPHYYLNGTGYENLEDVDREYEPLPLDHERTQLWIACLFGYFHNCYADPKQPDNASANTVIYPVPDYKLKQFVDDTRFSDEWRTKEKASIEQANAEIIEQARQIATLDNHKAVRFIRKYYPEFQPTTDMLKLNGYGEGNWWTRYEKQPTPETCRGEDWQKHPVNGSWCQVCGWRADSDNKQKE